MSTEPKFKKEILSDGTEVVTLVREPARPAEDKTAAKPADKKDKL